MSHPKRNVLLYPEFETLTDFHEFINRKLEDADRFAEILIQEFLSNHLLHYGIWKKVLDWQRLKSHTIL
ncbi:uncharacterized protein N7469_010845 [Penicillium citrinum]|uniref:Uncharacterized protein n=1 Tax=Penicillium citrinum TaxID=5077 RepID=A0A9W9TGM8_PENCI|nr:uncharacterized protein N7469_010845 [Penicillium citrinum]KAJ5221958.1 hypothetical protein N7469_010845 [Penicillium citrinum]